MMTSFADLGLNAEILKGLTSLGFTRPTEVQEQVLPLMLAAEQDLVCLAQTGTGKTAAFGLPLLQSIRRTSKQTQGLILCPTRELCMQVCRDLQAFGRYLPGLKIAAIYGGAPMEAQLKALARGVHVIVATPGRLADFLRRGKVDISSISSVVFDEADEMLQMGFQEELNGILAATPADKKTLLFSATMSKAVAAIAGNYMRQPLELTIGTKNSGSESISHEYYLVPRQGRYEALKRVLDCHPEIYSIIFCRTRQETHDIAARLVQDGYSADSLHGDLSQGQRDQVMAKFRRKNLQLLVATDVAARGLDVDDLSHVINYNLPDDSAAYTHRSGRTGRAGRLGTSVLLLQGKELYKIRILEKKLQRSFKQCQLPTGREICEKQLAKLATTVNDHEVTEQQFSAALYQQVIEQLAHLDRDELIKKFISLQAKPLLDYYQQNPDLKVEAPAKSKKGKERRTSNGKGSHSSGLFTSFVLNVGRRQGIAPQGLLGRINTIPHAGRIKVGKIEIMRNSARLEAESKFSSEILAAFDQATINGKTVTIAIAQERQAHKRVAGKNRKRQRPAYGRS